MKEIAVNDIINAVRDMCISANLTLADDMQRALREAAEKEKNPLGKKIMGQLKENMKIAGEDKIPICQDTGMAVFFVRLGQEVHLDGGLTEAINEGDEVEVDFDSGVITDKTTGKTFQGQAFPPFMQKIIDSEGLVNYINNK